MKTVLLNKKRADIFKKIKITTSKEEKKLKCNLTRIKFKKVLKLIYEGCF